MGTDNGVGAREEKAERERKVNDREDYIKTRIKQKQ